MFFLTYTQMEQLLDLGVVVKKTWKSRSVPLWQYTAQFNNQDLAYHLKYEASPGLVFQGIVENWSLDQIKFVVGKYRPDVVCSA